MHYVVNGEQDGEVSGRERRFEGGASQGSASDWLLHAPSLGIDACFHSDYKHTCVRYVTYLWFLLGDFTLMLIYGAVHDWKTCSDYF